jgi:EmrB/QacA subfamily drug resistance transporter
MEVSDSDDQLDPSIWKIVSVTVIGAFLSLLSATIVNVSLSSLASEFRTSLSTINWITSGYLLALTLALPLSGWLVDRMGARVVYLWCLGAFTLCSTLCGTAWSASSLIAFRVLQGASGGLLAPLTQMLLARAAGKHLARVIGYASVPVLFAPLLGPIVAGALLKYASWRWLFLSNLPIGACAVIVAAVWLPPDSHHTRPRDLDWIGLALLSPGLAMFLYATDHLGDRVGLVTLTAAVLLLTLFFWSARRKGDSALIDLRVFRGKVFAASAVTQFLSNGVQFAGQMLIPIYLIRACGRTESEMGWLMVPLGLGMMCAFPSMGTLTGWFGIRRVSIGGALFALLGTLPLWYLATHGLSLTVLATALFIRGMGLGGVGVPSISAAYAAVKRRELPMATTSLNIVQRLGGPTLTTLCATLLASRLRAPAAYSSLPNPYATAFLLLVAFHTLLVAAAARLPSR